MGDDTPPSRGSAVPTAGSKKGGADKKGDEPDAGGMEPQPQGCGVNHNPRDLLKAAVWRLFCVYCNDL
jgi:hypothetical protein